MLMLFLESRPSKHFPATKRYSYRTTRCYLSVLLKRLNTDTMYTKTYALVSETNQDTRCYLCRGGCRTPTTVFRLEDGRLLLCFGRRTSSHTQDFKHAQST